MRLRTDCLNAVVISLPLSFSLPWLFLSARMLSSFSPSSLPVKTLSPQDGNMAALSEPRSTFFQQTLPVWNSFLYQFYRKVLERIVVGLVGTYALICHELSCSWDKTGPVIKKRRKVRQRKQQLLIPKRQRFIYL